MSQRMKKQSAFLIFLSKAHKKQIKLLLSSLTSEQLDVIGEIALNIYTGVFPVSKRYVLLLKPFQKHIRLLASREISAKKKQDILIKHQKLISVLLKPVIEQLRKA